MQKYNLLFMGDSLTAGVYSDGKLDYSRDSYPDMVTNYFKDEGILKSSYNIAVSGYTTADVVKQLSSELTFNENIAYNITPENTYRKFNYRKKNTVKLIKPDIKIRKLLKSADYIIMTLGSNDVIKYLNEYSDSLKEILDIKNLREFSDPLVDEMLSLIIRNFKIIFQQIYEINPNVKIYLIGSYFPNKYKLINKMFDKFFASIEDKIIGHLLRFDDRINYIAIREDIKDNKDVFLDNPMDIHLNAEGYKFVAQKVIENILWN